jgi:hypothetical protein
MADDTDTDAQWDEASAQHPRMIPDSQTQTQTGLHCLLSRSGPVRTVNSVRPPVAVGG